MLTYFGLDFDIDKIIDEVNALLDSLSCMDIDKWKVNNRAIDAIREETELIVRISTKGRAQTITRHFDDAWKILTPTGGTQASCILFH